jgi:hypothetical protein
MSLITLPAPTSPPVVVVKKKLKDLRQTFGRQASVDRASFFMLQLYRSNLEVRLRRVSARYFTA